MKHLIIVILFFFGFADSCSAQILDDIVERKILKERRVLKYAPIREADIFWEKRVWRVLDVREKMNQTFSYPKAPFFQLIIDAAKQGDLTLYTTENDQFSYELKDDDLDNLLYERDTIAILDPETFEMIYEPIENEINVKDIKRFRIKEVWYVDENSSTMKVRILGIAPMKDVVDEQGNFRYEKPLFWIYYPELRHVLARHEVFNPHNDASLISWEDLFEMRYFASSIYKASNILDNRLKDQYTGVDRLLEGDKINQEVFNFESDLWSN